MDFFLLLLQSLILIYAHSAVNADSAFEKFILATKSDEDINNELKDTDNVGDMIFEKSSTRMAKTSAGKWPNGIVPYIISDNVTDLRPVVLNATQYINTYTCLRFRPVQPTDTTWIRFLMKKGASSTELCSSYVGWLNRRDQGVFLGPKCVFGSMVHELLHAVGFNHEHTRNDRDQFIRVNRSNFANDGVADNYKLDREGCGPNDQQCVFDDYGIQYNYESIMHYCQYCTPKDSRYPVFTIIQNANSIGDPKKVGQRSAFSRGDYLMVNRRYNCPIREDGSDGPEPIPDNPEYQSPEDIGPPPIEEPAEPPTTASAPQTTGKPTSAKPAYCIFMPFSPVC